MSRTKREGDTHEERERRARVATLRVRGGQPISQIARELHVHRRTVERYVQGVPRRG